MTKETVYKYLKIGGLVLCVVALGVAFFILKHEQSVLLDKQNSLEIEMKKFQDETARSRSEYVSKEDLDKFGKDLNLNLEQIRNDLKKFDASIKAINTVVVQTPGSHETNIPSTTTEPGKPVECVDNKCKDPYGHFSNVESLALNENMGNINVPFGNTKFRAWEQNPWEFEVYPRKYGVSTVLGQDIHGRHYTYNHFSVEVDGKKYDIPISSSELKEEKPEPQFFVNPRLFLGLDIGATIQPLGPEVIPNIQVGIFSYGTTMKIEDSQFTFLNVGIGYNAEAKLPSLIISPFNYNIGHDVPYVDNLWVGPSVAVDIKGDFTVGAGIRVGL